MTGYDLGLEIAGPEEEVRKTGEQIWCLLRCAERTLAVPMSDCELMAPSPLLSIMSTVQGCTIPASKLPYSDIRFDGQGRQEKSLVQGFLHTPSSAHDNPNTVFSSDYTPSALLILLRALPSHIAECLGKPESIQDVFAMMSAIETLVRCCGISFACDEAETAWQGMATWMADVPDHFNQMIRRHQPAALVVIAHWAAVLVKRAEHLGCWFLKGSARIIVLQVAKQLSANSLAALSLIECLMGIFKD